MSAKETVNEFLYNFYYGYLNIHLDLLSKAIKENNQKEINFQSSQIKKCREELILLGYFEGK